MQSILKKSLFSTFLILNLNAMAECKKNIHLTFDDGPLLGKTNKVFDALEKHNVKATFFVNTHYLNSGQAKFQNGEKKLYDPIYGAATNYNENKKRRWLLKKMKDAGHKIGSHGFGHFSFKDRDPAYPKANLQGRTQKKRNIELSTQVLKGFMSEPYLFRLPYGKPFRGANGKMRDQVNDYLSNDYDINVGWKTDSRDWEYEASYNRAKGAQKEAIRKQFVKEAADKMCSTGGITVLHDIKNITGDALDDLISEVKRRGGEFVDFNQSAIDPEQKNALETLSTTGVKFCQGTQESLTIAPKAQKLANDDIGNIMNKIYPNIIETFSTSQLAENAMEQLSYSANCIQQQNSYGRVEIRCQSPQRYIHELNPNNYPNQVGSFRNKDYAVTAIEKELSKGRDCEIFPIITAEGIPFNRVACK